MMTMQPTAWEYIDDSGVPWEVHGATYWRQQVYCFQHRGRCVGMFDPQEPDRSEPDTSSWPGAVREKWRVVVEAARAWHKMRDVIAKKAVR
jgi:hypothetical protein